MQNLARYGFGCGWILLLLAWVVPNHYAPWSAFYSEALAFAGLFSLGCGAFAKGNIRIALTGVTVVVLPLMAIPMIQYYLGIVYFFGDALMATLYLGAFWVAYLVGQNGRFLSANFDQLVSWLMWLLFVGACISAYIVVCQVLQVGFGVWMVDSNPNAEAMGISVSQIMWLHLCVAVW